MSQRALDLPIKIFADGADLQGIAELYRKPYIRGLTTNPTLMRKAGLTDYETFARAVLKEVKSKPISFEVFSDDFPEMRRQALKSATGRTTFTLRSRSQTREANPPFR
jgi:transaldolase